MSEKLNSLKEAGRLASEILSELDGIIRPGLNLLDIENYAARRINEAGMNPGFLGYKGYPAVTCISVNSAIVHGIPYHYTLQNGDIVAVDLGVKNNGWLVDTARTYGAGKISKTHADLLQTTEKALERAIAECLPGKKVGDISYAVQSTVEADNFHIVRELTGHGVGKTLQEPPSIPNFGKPNQGALLKEGMVLAIEPITTERPTRVVLLEDGWTIASANDAVSAHFEHTVYVAKEGPIILTS